MRRSADLIRVNLDHTADKCEKCLGVEHLFAAKKKRGKKKNVWEKKMMEIIKKIKGGWVVGAEVVVS